MLKVLHRNQMRSDVQHFKSLQHFHNRKTTLSNERCFGTVLLGSFSVRRPFIRFYFQRQNVIYNLVDRICGEQYALRA